MIYASQAIVTGLIVLCSRTHAISEQLICSHFALFGLAQGVLLIFRIYNDTSISHTNPLNAALTYIGERFHYLQEARLGRCVRSRQISCLASNLFYLF